ncbi:MAG: hypothetical protein ACLFTT_18020 [Candidatus Hydrogenedentota bacterium]
MKRFLLLPLLAVLVAAGSGCATTTPGGKRTHPRSQDQTGADPVRVQNQGQIRNRANSL